MNTAFKIFTGLCAFLTAITLIVAAMLAFDMRDGAEQAVGLTFMVITTWLGILGFFSLV